MARRNRPGRKPPEHDAGLEDLPYYLISGVCFGSIIALVALGYSLVYGIIKLINFAHGEFYMVGAYTGFGIYLLLEPWHLPVWLSIPIIVLASGAGGALIAGITEFIAYKPIRNAGRLTPLLTAIGVSFFLQSVFSFVRSAQPLQYPTEPQGSIGGICQSAVMVGDDGIYAIKLVYVLVSAVLTTLLWLLVMRTSLGRAMRAVSEDAAAASLMGIDVDRVIRQTFMLGGFLAGVAGALIAFQSTITPTMGFGLGLKAFIAAVVGGIGSIPGTVIGGFLIGITDYLVVWAGVPTGYKDIAAFGVLILALILRPQGILGKQNQERV